MLKFSTFLSLLSIITSLCLAQNQFFKKSRVNYKVGGLPWSVVSEDFNNDGNPDIATCSRQERSVTLLLGRGDGTFHNRKDFNVGISPRSLAAADFNSDGNMDIATANLLSDDITILIGNGDGTFRDSVNYPSGVKTRFIISEDFNSDNVPDLAAANRDDGSISVFTGVGDGTFRSPWYILTPDGFNPRQITSADFNNDNIPDIVVIHDDQSSSPVPRAVYFQGNGDGTFETGIELILATQGGPFNESVSVASGDFNNDNNNDVIVGIDESTSGYLNILSGNGDGSFQSPQLFNVYKGLFAIEVTDLNSDDNSDIVCLIANGKAFSVHMGNGDGTFTNELPPDIFDEPDHYTVGQYPRFLTSADVNKDQKQDILVAVEDAGEAAVLLGNGDSTFSVADEYRVGIPPQSFPLGGLAYDFNDDGNKDLAVANWGFPNDTSVVTILYGKGDGTFPDSVNYKCGINPRDIETGDFNNDGVTDIAVANNRDTVISILFGKPDGSFDPAVAVSIGHDPALTLPVYPDLAVDDFNGDSEEDIAVVNYNQQKIHVIYGDGEGGFSEPSFVNLSSHPLQIKADDFNNDNYSDLAVMSAEFSTLNQITVLPGNGNGGFQNPVITQIPATLIYHFNFAYLDDDNIIDMMVVEGEEDKVFIYKGKGDGSFTQENTIDAFEPDAVSGAHLDSDDNTDLIIVSGSNSEVSVYFGDGSFNFTQPEESFGVQGGGFRAIDSDFDNDGDTDLAITKGIFGYGSVSILLNQSAVTRIRDDKTGEQSADNFTLKQNYPNPFNPVTKIKYQLKVSGLTEIKVHDVLGRVIATLVNEYKTPGSYTIEYNASHLPSGIYFYTIRSGSFTETRKMVLLK